MSLCLAVYSSPEGQQYSSLYRAILWSIYTQDELQSNLSTKQAKAKCNQPEVGLTFQNIPDGLLLRNVSQ